MATNQATKSSYAQLSEFGDAFWKASLSVAVTVVFGFLIYYPILHAVGAFEIGRQYLATDLIEAYLVSSGLGLTLYISASHIRKSADSEDNSESDESENKKQSFREQLKGAILDIYNSWSVITYIFIMVGLGTVFGLLANSYGATSIAPIIAITYPMVDWLISQQAEYPVTPSGMLLVASNLVIVPLTVLIAIIGTILGLVFGFLTGLVKGLLTPIRAIFQYLRTAGVDEATKEPLKGARRRFRLQR
jgi:hypothetical protein